jgi:formylglycine-generating enzyme required for sulfatase activity
MVFIPPGEFQMGDKNSANGVSSIAIPHDVFLDGFLIDKTEVSNRAYRKFIEAGGYNLKELRGKRLWSEDGWTFKSERKEPEYWGDENLNKDNYPVVGVSWYEADAYCRFLDKRLPTEAEWEKAARGPEGYEWSIGNDPNEIETKVNSVSEQDGYEYTAPVIERQFGSNGYGLYHMSGNVWEWVYDFYNGAFYYEKGTEKNPVNSKATNFRSVRGGSWNINHWSFEVSLRGWFPPAIRHGDIGFRCARTP